MDICHHFVICFKKQISDQIVIAVLRHCWCPSWKTQSFHPVHINPGALTPKSTHHSPLLPDISFTVWSKATAPEWRIWFSPMAPYRDCTSAAAFPESESLKWEPQRAAHLGCYPLAFLSVADSWNKRIPVNTHRIVTDSSSLWVHRHAEKKKRTKTKVRSSSKGNEAQWLFLANAAFLSQSMMSPDKVHEQDKVLF